MAEFEQSGRMTYNMEEVEETSWEVLPKGRYEVQVGEVEVRESDKGNTYWALILNIIRNIDTGAVPENNAKAFLNLTFSAKSMGMMKKNLRAINPELAVKRDLDPWEDHTALQGCCFGVKLDIQKWNDEPRNQVKNCFPLEQYV